MLIDIKKEAFDALKELQKYKEGMDIEGQYGATASFVGSMRDINEDKKVTHMTLEHYPGMTEKHLDAIASDAIEKWKLLKISTDL